MRSTEVTTEATTETDGDFDVYRCPNMTLETNVLHLAVNEEKKELQVMKEVSLEKAMLPPSYHYHDIIAQYDPQEVPAAMKKERKTTRSS